jgi:hypothetical protein
VNLDDRLERLQADGKITTLDADEVRRFRDFLTAMHDAGIRPAKPGEPRSPEDAARAREIYLAHYPEYAPGGGS